MSDLAELDSAYVEQTVARLEARIGTDPDRRLGDAAHLLQTAVPQIHRRFRGIEVRRRAPSAGPREPRAPSSS